MVEIRDIQKRVSESATIREVIDDFMRLACAQAVCVRVMPWLLCAPNQEVYWRYLSYPWISHESQLPPFFWDKWLAPNDIIASFPGQHSTMSMSDIDARFRSFPSFFKEDKEFEYPFQVILQVNMERLDTKQIEQIQQIIRNDRVFVTAERRPPLKLQLSSGRQFNSGKQVGTMGGFIRTDEKIFCVTCSHVVENATVTDTAGHNIGAVVAQSSLTAMKHGTDCTPLPPRHTKAASMNSNDVALIEMSASVNCSGYAKAPIKELHQSDVINVALHYQPLRSAVRSLCVAMRISHRGADYCFAPLIELYSPDGTTRPGDSGAWGLNAKREWASMIVGADTISSFAIDARCVADWIDDCGIVSKGQWTVF